jgi:hypothetical protein
MSLADLKVARDPVRFDGMLKQPSDVQITQTADRRRRKPSHGNTVDSSLSA